MRIKMPGSMLPLPFYIKDGRMSNEELTKAIQSGEYERMEQLWTQCRGFVYQQANRWARAWANRPDFDIDDLMQAGYIALCEAVRGFQEEKGHSFISYLAFHLKTEFARCAGCRTPAQAKEPLNHATSLDAPAYNDPENDTTIGENIPVVEPGFEIIEEDIFNQQIASLLDQALDTLPEKQREVIEMYYLRRFTYLKIAELLECSHSRAGQLVKDGLKRLRNGKYAPLLSEIYYGDRNYYKHTSYSAWKYSGTSSPERELLWKERQAHQRLLKHCVDHMGMTMEEAQALFPL